MLICTDLPSTVPLCVIIYLQCNTVSELFQYTKKTCSTKIDLSFTICIELTLFWILLFVFIWVVPSVYKSHTGHKGSKQEIFYLSIDLSLLLNEPQLTRPQICNLDNTKTNIVQSFFN